MPLSWNEIRSRAHLDRAVDAAYGKKGFAGAAERVALPFGRYQALVSLLPAVKSPKRRLKLAKHTG